MAVRYGSARQPVTALEGVDLRIRAGEFVVLVGPSDCGKTSLLRVVAGFERPSSGTALVRGAVPRPGGGAGVVFQQPRLFPWRTVGGNLGFALARHGVPRAERAGRIAELLERAGPPGTTVLFVTHSAEEAVLLGSRVLVMAAGPGRVVAELPVGLDRGPETDVAALRASAEFARLRGRLTEAVRRP
ncbi:ATP-binding cassette domain-containing protein [Streptomyces sp. H34-S5]|nr:MULTISPECIES: ATP-binding cassette domain-containing protein [unclassified Streptomyces]MCY0944916.1 ATP-binding cassette domain-containing protein [Streptomyces sp. H34-AA3]MCZ4083321.1 ATP-binding cassette domain-containing protein [Streptomyces sp. H34-S5]